MRAATLLLFLLLSAPAFASQFTPDDLYRYRYVRLANGLDVFLKPRAGAHNVSMRMVVHVGTYDFPCGVKETPHFLEHLLFTGTSKHSESELDALIEDNGGSWNASTGGEKTTYQVDIYDRFAPLALDTLYEILTDSRFAEENIERSRGIIHRESGGVPSAFRNWLYSNGIGRSARDKVDDLIWPASSNCDELETANGIDRKQILQAWQQYYVPNNMALVVVGNFQEQKMLARIKQSFGSLQARSLPAKAGEVPPEPTRQRVTGTFSPILGTEAHVSLHYQTLGYESDQVFEMILLNDYLAQEIFRELRVERGLAYAPSSDMGFDRNVGVIALSSDSELSKIGEVEQAMLDLVARLRGKQLSHDDLSRIRRRVLLAYAQGYEDNASIASHYASVWRRFEHKGKIVDLETRLQRITPAQLERLMQKVLDPARVVIAVSRPTLSYHLLYSMLSGLLLTGAIAIVYYWWRRKKTTR